MIRGTIVGLALVAACAKPPEGPPQRTDSAPAAPAPLAYLTGLAGQYPADAGVWESEPLRSRMTRLLGGDYEAFRENIRTSGPVSVENSLVYVTGNCPSNAKVWGAALLVADPAADRLLIKVYSQAWDSVRTYQDAEITVLPKDVMTTLANWSERTEQARKPKAAATEKKKEGG